MEPKHCLHLIARENAISVTVLILSMVLFLLSGPVLVKGQGGVYLFGDNVMLQCVSGTQSVGEQFIWIDDAGPVIYSVSGPDDYAKTPPAMSNEKYNNFGLDNNYPNDVNLLINLLEVNDAGSYTCTLVNQDPLAALTVDVEAMPISVSISCARSSSTDCPSPSSSESNSFCCNCIAIGAYPNSLHFNWSGDATDIQQSHSSSSERNDTFDYNTDAVIVPTENPGSVTCTLNGYNQTWEGVRNAVYNFNPPMCELQTTCIRTGNVVSLTCTCTGASPAEGLVYSFYRDGELLPSGDTNVVEADIEVDREYIFSCRGCNGVNYGNSSNDTQTVMCQRSTTALPTTTISTVPLSTNEPTNTKAMGTTTAEPKSKSTDNPESGALGTGAIVGISLGALAVVIVIVVIAVIMCKKDPALEITNDFRIGECGSKSDSSYATDGNSTDKDIYEDELSMGFNEKTDENMRSNTDNGIVNDGMETPTPPIYAEVKKKSNKQGNNDAGPGVDPEMKADGVIYINKQDNNGAGPGVDPEMTADGVIYVNKQDNNGADPGVDPEMTADGVIYVNTVKENDPTRDLRSSMRDTKYTSKPPKQMGTQSSELNHDKKGLSNEMGTQSSELDHDKKGSSNEVRKLNEEPTEMGTQSSELDHDKKGSSNEMEMKSVDQ